MKKIYLLILAAGLWMSCGNKAVLERLQAELDSLRTTDQDKGQDIEQYIADVNDIYGNLEAVKAKQGQISSETSSSGSGELAPSIKSQIEADIADIQQLMED